MARNTDTTSSASGEGPLTGGGAAAGRPTDDRIRDTLARTLAYSRERDYVGWDYWDGMSSRFLRRLPFDNRWVNLAVQEGIKRAPVNLRPLLRVEQRPSPKGLSLFTLANAHAYAVTGESRYREEALGLADRVVDHDLDAYEGFCLYHNHEIQMPSETIPVGTPGVVATSYGVKALLAASEFDDRYAAVARSAAEFVESELDPTRDGDEIRVRYKATDDGDSYTLNANALVARMYVDLYEAFGDPEFRETATGILTYVADRQQPVGGWKYTDPPSASHLSMDNFHNGFIVESFHRYRSVVDPDAFGETFERALEFYRTELFDETGAPRWDESSTYPRDIHAAAQGIVLFSLADDPGFARRIVDWTLRNLYAGDGRFYYQRRKYYTKRFTLMRWCQAWMAYALSLLARVDASGNPS